MVNEKLTQKPETSEISEDALIHVVEPNDLSQGPDGSSYKMKASNLPAITQDNIDIRKSFNILLTDGFTEILAKINMLFPYVVNEKQSVWFIAKDTYSPGVPQRIFKYKMMNKGKGIYGGGQTPILAADLELMFSGNITTGDIENDPETDTVNFGDLTGQNVSQWLNLQDPAIVIQPQDEGYTIFTGTVDTVPFTYLWIGEPGVYGVGESTSDMTDFQELSDDPDNPQTLQQTNEAGNVTTIPMVVHDPDNEQKVSYEANGQVYTDSEGNTISVNFPEAAETGDAVYNYPAKTGVQTKAMLSDIPVHATEAETYAKTVTNKTVVPAGLAAFQKVLTESPEQFTDFWYGTKEEYDALDALYPYTAYFVSEDLSFMGEVNEDFTTSQDADSLNPIYGDDYPVMYTVVAPLVSTGEVYIKLTSDRWMILSGTLSNPT